MQQSGGLIPGTPSCRNPLLEDTLVSARACDRGRRSALLAGLAAGLALVMRPLGVQRCAASATDNSDVVAELANMGSIQSADFPVWESTAESAAVKRLVETAGPEIAELGTPAVDWPGLWRVVYAPHIRTLGSLALAKFDVYYDIAAVGTDLEVRSFVRFQTPLGSGWLNAAGRVSQLDQQLEVPGCGLRPTSEVAFSDFWVDLGTPQPRRSPDSDVDQLLGRLAAPFFFKELSRFPTLLFDARRGLCIFRFPPLGVEIAAKRVGPSGSGLRPLAM